MPVLIVDDNAAKRLAMKSVLLPLGYTIVEADSGVAALRCVMAQDFAVILLDVCMPIIDGFETAALIRQRRQSEMTPIIFITGYANDELTTSTTTRRARSTSSSPPSRPTSCEPRSRCSQTSSTRARARRAGAERAGVGRPAATLTEAAPIGIFQTDAENRYVYTNPRWTEITGTSADEALGQDIRDASPTAEQRSDLVADLATTDRWPIRDRPAFEIHLPGCGAAHRAGHLEVRFPTWTAATRAGSGRSPT